MQPGDDFEWDKDNEEKLAARHGVDRYEAEQAAVDFGSRCTQNGSQSTVLEIYPQALATKSGWRS
jgi:hypothetical protein